ncbi:MAG: dTDP-4-dehydrorhamnose 3,5-epimerase [Thermoanaerobaculia bacterium]
MKVRETKLPGVYLIEPERQSDDRGFFARTFCSRELAELGLVSTIAQSSISFNPTEGTLRGMHYQAPPHGETKIIRCTMGAIWDCLIDLRPDSPTYRGWLAEELTAENRKLFYVPEGIAHGFLTLAPNTEVFYEISTFFVPEAARGVRWDDPAFGVDWPRRPRLLSDRDRTYEDFE